MSDKETVTLKIDGIEVTVDKGSKVYDAAQKAGVYLPGLCYDPKLTRFGGCRMCVVDITSRGRTRGKWACCEPASNGVEVTTDSDGIRKKRQIMMEFLLMYHPLDCPTCNESGACGLQDAAFYIKQKKGRAPQKRRNEPLLIDNPVLERDFNKCILCGKCVIICDEIQGKRAIDFQQRGFEAEVGTELRVPLDCDYCGQCLAVCPTGSFQDHTEDYKGHDWEYTKTVTTCPYCAVGCSIVINTKGGKIVKVSSDDYVGVNNGNLCAKGRFGHEAYQADDRIKTPMVKGGSGWDLACWAPVLDEVAEKLKDIAEKNGPDSIAVVVGESLSNEDAFMVKKAFGEGLGVKRIDSLSNMRNRDLNSGLMTALGSSAPIVSYDEIKKAGAFLFVGCDAEKENPVIANMIRVAMRDNKTPLYVANARDTLFEPHEKLRVRYNYGGETALVAGIVTAVLNAATTDRAKELGKSAKKISLKHAEEYSGVATKDIKTLAEGLTANGAPMIFMGSEIFDHQAGADIARAVADLADVTGGKALLYREYCNSQGVNDMGIGADSPDGDLFTDIAGGRVKALVLAGADPSVFARDGKSVLDAIGKAEYVVATSSYMNASAELADVVLPSCVAVEREGTLTNNEGRVQQWRKAVEPLGDSKPDWRIFSKLGSLLGVDCGCSKIDEITSEIAQKIDGYAEITPKSLMWGGQQVSYSAESVSYQYGTEPMEIPASDGYTHRVLFGNSLYHIGSLSHRSKALTEIENDVMAELDFDEAEKNGLSEGDNIRIESEKSSINAVVRISDSAVPGIVFIPKSFSDNPALTLAGRADAATMVKITKVASE